MQYLYHKDSGLETIKIEGDEYRYLFRVRRLKADSFVETRNLQDGKLHVYKVISIDKKSALLQLAFSETKEVKAPKSLTIGWCIIDPKVIEKTLPTLNEMGVEKIVFIKCAYSQANFKIKKDKLHKILINSSQQCGRTNLMHIEFANSINDYLNKYPNSHLLDFSKNRLDCSAEVNSIVIGCEGGISKDERALFESNKIVGLNTPQILRSESAAIAVASKILL